MDDESGESMEPMEEVPLIQLGEVCKYSSERLIVTVFGKYKFEQTYIHL